MRVILRIYSKNNNSNKLKMLDLSGIFSKKKIYSTNLRD